MSYQSFEQVLQKCHTEEKEFWQVILEDDMAERNVSLQESMEHMRATWDAMLLAAVTYEETLSPPVDWWAAMADEWRNTPIIPVKSHCVGIHG